jgi:excinuclease UvrABC ATPase subunit
MLDEPFIGLHLTDLEQALELVDRVVDSGRLVTMIEHH